MKTLVITLSVAAMATTNIFATEAFLSPRAADNQPKIVSGVNHDPNLTAVGLPSGSPRLADNEVKSAPGETQEAAVSVCERHMAGTPRMVGECAEHPGSAMSCCSGSIAENK